MPSLLIQTGAVRGAKTKLLTSNSQPQQQSMLMAAYRQAVRADEALQRRPYETNARIRFNHRGQVAMALGVKDDEDVADLQPQFFITTEAADYLDGQHVVFGTLGAGPTVFNAIRIATATAVDEATHQPHDLEHAPRITAVKIVEHPFLDGADGSSLVSVPASQIPWRRAENDGEPKKRKKKRKGKLDVNVLSFGEEMGDVATMTRPNHHPPPRNATTTVILRRQKAAAPILCRKKNHHNNHPRNQRRIQLGGGGGGCGRVVVLGGGGGGES